MTAPLLALLTGILYPAYCMITSGSVKRRIRQSESYRLTDYKQTILIFWVLTILILLNLYSGHPPEFSLMPGFSLLESGLLGAVLLFAFVQYRSMKVTPENADELKQKIGDIAFYLPRSQKEFMWFCLLSISAGICEEIIFRVFLFEFISDYVHVIAAFILTNLLFAITHLSTGMKNLVGTFILGLIFSSLYYFTGNIWIAIILHIAIDINTGVLGDKLDKLGKLEKLEKLEKL